MEPRERMLIGGCLLVALFFTVCSLNEVYAYTDPANVTSSSLSDMRVNPSQSVTWTLGPVWNSTDQPVGGGNSSLSFNGINQRVIITDDASLKPIEISVEAWVKLKSGGTDHFDSTPLSKGTNTFTCGFQNSPSPKMRFEVTFVGGNIIITGGTTVNLDKWLYVAYVYDGSNMILYLNGVQDAIQPKTDVIDWSMVNLYICSNNFGGYDYSVVDESRIYNRTLSPTEIAQHYQGVFLNETGLVLYLDLDGEALDQSGNGNDGTLFNGPAYVDGWASVPVSTYFNGTQSVANRRILVNSTTGDPLSTIPDAAPTPIGPYNGTIAPDNSIGNGTITGFIVDRYEVYLEAQYEETEAGFSTLLTAQGSSAVDSHALGLGDSFTIDGVAFTWNTYTSNFTAIDTKATPQTVTYGTAITGTEANYTITNFSVNNTATVTWTTGTLERLQSWFITGDWIGAAFSELFLVTGQVAGVTLILAIFSLAAYQYSGPYATFGIWLFGWGVFISQVHGTAQQLGVLLFAVGVGLALAKLINDRRNA